MKISICTQIKNRLHQFKNTFYKNIKIIEKHPNIEWVIVDVNSSDGLEHFIKSNLYEKIKFYQTIENTEYSIPIAKNFSYRLSDGDYIFSLDADNFLGSIIDKIIEMNYCGVFCDVYRLGVYGRIGCSKNILRQTGGYDESFLPAGHHEQDFMSRCELLGYRFTHVDFECLPIQNDKNDTVKNMSNSMSWSKMNEINLEKKTYNLLNGIVNPNKFHKKCNFTLNFGTSIKLETNF